MISNVNLIATIDKLTRVSIATLFALLCSELFFNFQYSGISFYLFAISIAAVALPFSEALAVYLISMLIIQFGHEYIHLNIHLTPEKLPTNLENLNTSILSMVLRATSIIPIAIFGFIKRKNFSTSVHVLTIVWIIASWLLYSFAVPILYVAFSGNSVTGLYVPIYRYLFSKNILIHLSLGIFICTIFPVFWTIIEKKRKRIRNKYQKLQ